jgi:O-antigen/teichoic acid export membrane protein
MSPPAWTRRNTASSSPSSLTEHQHRQLAATTRTVAAACFFLWLVLAVIVLAAQGFIVDTLKVRNPAAIWVTMLVVLVSLMLPIIKGLLQGRQDFMGLGWVAILDGLGRITTLTVIVLVLGGQAAGAMTGALLGQLTSLGVGLWFCRDILREPGAGFVWKPWLQRVIPLTLGTGALLFLSSSDAIYIQSIFPANQSPFYAPGALVGFALVQFTVPLAAVMFPKIVRSAARAEKTDALKLTLATTAILGILAALASTLLPKLPLQILYAKKPEFWAAAPLVPWFVWCMLFFTLANVLVGNLLAREKFGIVPWLVILAGAYGVALGLLKDHLLTLPYLDAYRLLVQTMGAFNIVLFLLAIWFTWGSTLRDGKSQIADSKGGGGKR